eukprot:1142646-Pelagomonas_calceolata.AAC.9
MGISHGCACESCRMVLTHTQAVKPNLTYTMHGTAGQGAPGKKEVNARAAHLEPKLSLPCLQDNTGQSFRKPHALQRISSTQATVPPQAHPPLGSRRQAKLLRCHHLCLRLPAAADACGTTLVPAQVAERVGCSCSELGVLAPSWVFLLLLRLLSQDDGPRTA